MLRMIGGAALTRSSRGLLARGGPRLGLVRLVRLVLCLVDDRRQLGPADPVALQQLGSQLAQEVLVLEEVGLGCLPSVAEALAAVSDPGAALFQQTRLDAEVD